MLKPLIKYSGGKFKEYDKFCWVEFLWTGSLYDE